MYRESPFIIHYIIIINLYTAIIIGFSQSNLVIREEDGSVPVCVEVVQGTIENPEIFILTTLDASATSEYLHLSLEATHYETCCFHDIHYRISLFSLLLQSWC